jgi:hypothetical protein
MTGWNRRIFVLAALLLPLGLASCGVPQSDEPARYGSTASTGSSGQHVAVSHEFTLRLPSDEIEAAQRRHLDECQKLGCTIISTSMNREETRVRASTAVRIPPAAFPAFADLITAPPATVLSHEETSDDKTTAVLDVEKRLEAKIALRDRLTAMLRGPAPKTAADLVAIERELAQVQGDIEAGTAQRDYLRTITGTVKVNITYRGSIANAGGLDISPIATAFKSTGGVFVQSLARVIVFIAMLVPWLPLVYLAYWVIRRAIRRWRTPKTPA